MNGEIVRLTHGDPETAKVYSQFGGPVETAKKWQAEGAKKLHIIDLDAALGIGNNLPVIAEIAENTAFSIQVGGGIRNIEAVEKVLGLGISQVILGALAFSNPQAVTQIQQSFGAKSVVVALDNRDGKVMIEGWKTDDAPPLVTYEVGSWGPKESDDLLRIDGHVWNLGCLHDDD